MKKPDLSIIIVSYNTKKITGDCIVSALTSLNRADFIFEIIIVDNNSHDGSVEMLKRYRSKNPSIVRLILNKENAGFGKANNQAVNEARGEYALLLNSDIVVLDDAIGTLFRFYKDNEKSRHFVGGKLLNRDMTPQPSCGPFYSLPVIFGALFLKGDHWGLTRYSPNTLKRVDWVSGACIITRKEYYRQLGGFDEGIFMYMEEVDLFFRARKRGLTIYFYPQSRFIHLGSASSQGKTYPIIQVYQGFLYLYKKHRSRLSLFLLKYMLQLKALVSVALGKLIRNKYLIETYEKAYQMVRMDRR